jgi:hypothetical protein
MRALALSLFLFASTLASPTKADKTLGPFPASVAAWTMSEKARQDQAAVHLQQDILAAISRGDHHFTIPPGDYRFEPSSLAQLRLHAVSDFTIDAAGATFWFYPFQRLDGLLLDECHGVTVRGLTIDYHITPYPQGVICGIDAKAGSIDFQLDPGYSTPFDLPGHLLNAKILFFDASGNLLEARLNWAKEVQDLGHGRYRVFSKRPSLVQSMQDLPSGAKLVLAGRTMRMAINLNACSACTLENITIYASPHMAMTELSGDGNTYRNCHIVRRPGTNRLLACNADVFHSSGARHGPTVEQCEFSWSGDDLINVHGFFSMVAAQDGPNEVTLLSQIEPGFPVGTRLRFYDYSSLAAIGESTVLESTEITDPAQVQAAQAVILARKLAYLKPLRVIRVRLAAPVKAVPTSIVTDDSRAAQGTIIRDCYLHDTIARGMLLKAGGGLIENNHIVNAGIASIGIADDLHFMEGPFSANITIRGNRIERSGWNDRLSREDWNYLIGAITVTSELDSGLPPAPVNEQIEITGNTIIDSADCGIFISNLIHGVIRDNQISGAWSKQPFGTGTRMRLPAVRSAVVVAESQAIDLENNTVSHPGSFSQGSFQLTDTDKDVGPQGHELPKTSK